jgi:hypothetical protein
MATNAASGRQQAEWFSRSVLSGRTSKASWLLQT